MELLVGTAQGLVFVGDETRHLFDGEVVSSLAWDGDAVLATVGGHVLHRVDAGTPIEVATSDQRLNCILSIGGRILAGAAEGRLLELVDDRFRPVASFDEAPGRAEWFTPWGGPPDVRSLAAMSSDEICANVHVGGILRSGDGGKSWEQTIDIRADVHEVIAVPAMHLLVAATAKGAAVSHDHGSTWAISDAGLHAAYCRAVAVTDGWIFLTASVGPHGGRSAIYRRAVESDRFERCSEGLPGWFGDNIDTGCVTVSGTSVAFGTSEGAVYLSEDAGESWSIAAEGLAPVRWLESSESRPPGGGP